MTTPTAHGSPRSREELAELDGAGWEHWLRDELGAWRNRFRTHLERLPFQPIPIRTDDSDPGGTLAHEIELTCGGRTVEAARAIERVLRSWSVDLDGLEGVEILLRLCSLLAAPNLIESIRQLLSHVTRAGESERIRLAQAIINALESRGSLTDLVELEAQLQASGAHSRVVAAEFVAAKSRNDVRRTPHLMEAAGLIWEDYNSPAMETVISRLLETHSASQLQAAWEPLERTKHHRHLISALRVFIDPPRDTAPETGELTDFGARLKLEMSNVVHLSSSRSARSGGGSGNRGAG